MASHQSKLANALFTLELDRRLRAAGASTISVGAHPGWSRTELQYRGPRLGGGVSARALGLLTRLVGQSAGRGALAVLRAATDPRPRGVTTSGLTGPARSGASRTRSATPRRPTTSRSPVASGRPPKP
jgi:hypothetical protein